jgi:hypothetical protein
MISEALRDKSSHVVQICHSRVPMRGTALAVTGPQWLELESDGNRKCRSGSKTHLNSRCYEIDRALRAIFV